MLKHGQHAAGNSDFYAFRRREKVAMYFNAKLSEVF